jgi:16S rRNA G527 N7-methylase RsmG
VELDLTALDRLDRYERWLGEEAIVSGGLGPAESNRLHDRHIGDSMLFASGFGDVPGQVLDIGSGVGLPGIPLAVLFPRTEFILLDRSGRRTDLARRATRILELENVQVEQGEFEHHRRQESVIVSRGTLPPDRSRDVIQSLLHPGGLAILGGSWTQRPEYEGWSTVEIPATVLDHTIWLLIMRQT